MINLGNLIKQGKNPHKGSTLNTQIINVPGTNCSSVKITHDRRSKQQYILKVLTNQCSNEPDNYVR